MSKIEEYLDQQRWLLNNGLFTDSAKDNLYLYGTLVHKDIRAVDMTVDPTVKKASYKLFFDAPVLKIHKQYQSLKGTQSLIGLLRLRYLLKKNGNLEFGKMLDGFVKAYCGPSWGAIIELKDIKEYVENAVAIDGDKDQNRGPDNG
jgi:hypothetical protein